MYLLENATDLEVFPKEESKESEKDKLFKKARDSIYTEIKNTKKFCDGLYMSFVKDSLKTCDAILKIESSMTRSKQMYGFAAINFLRNSKSLYIDTVCTNTDIKKTGTYIINVLTKICQQLSIESIKLSSATQAVPFYLKTEFECDDVCKMIKTIEIKKTKKNRKNTKGGNSKTRRT